MYSLYRSFLFIILTFIGIICWSTPAFSSSNRLDSTNRQTFSLPTPPLPPTPPPLPSLHPTQPSKPSLPSVPTPPPNPLEWLIEESFSSPNTSLTYNGSAYPDYTTGEAVLTQATGAYAGSLFFEKTVNTTHTVSEFDFRIEVLDQPGADGFTFAILQGVDPTYLGNGGADLGYTPIPPSTIKGLAIEFDTHNNYGVDAYSDNHVGVNINESHYSVITSSTLPRLEDNGTFHVEIVIKNGKIVGIYLSNDSINYPRTQVISYHSDSLESFWGHAGFTAGVGAFRNRFIIDNWKLR